MSLVGLIGKPSAGKTTFFRAATLADAKIAPYPFTTINPNTGVAYVRVECPCREFDLACGKCLRGYRFVPFEMIDAAGLVPGSHAGRGMGNKFLDDVAKSSVLIHVVDVSGTTDEEGNPCRGHDPIKDIEFIENELDRWFERILERNPDPARALSGLGVKSVPEYRSVSELRKKVKPIVVAANKCDVENNFLERVVEKIPEAIPCSAEYELVLRTAAERGMIDYVPGDAGFEVTGSPNEQQEEVLNRIREFLKKFGSTGVQKCIDRAVLEVLGYVVVFPVENESKLTNSEGEILPDAFLMPPGSTVLDLAYRIHTDIGKGFLYAVDCRTGMRVSGERKLSSLDVISVVSAGKR
ncbi:MAG: redox-regulated ATPase YchF [Candidatus Micrarchaeota archaeon]|nr:redox-regulated ATPase YchF [Candidatus Micrarchaeota archaeon]